MSGLREEVRRQVMDAYGVTAGEVERVDVMLGGPVLRERERRFLAALPGRMAEAEAEVNRRFADVLPEGTRFEWASGDD